MYCVVLTLAACVHVERNSIFASAFRQQQQQHQLKGVRATKAPVLVLEDEWRKEMEE